jgi:hypothetical protein
LLHEAETNALAASKQLTLEEVDARPATRSCRSVRPADTRAKAVDRAHQVGVERTREQLSPNSI